MYASPIEKIYGELQTQMVQEDENMVMKAVREVGITVDKEELINALQYDCKQYTKGYSDGKSDMLDKIKAEIDQKQYDFMADGDYNEGVRFGLMLAYQIIDKCKKEGSEVQDADSN